MDSLDAGHSGSIGKAQLAASQIDWRHLQQSNMEGWLEAVERCFRRLDADGDGVWSCHDILDCLQAKLSPSEVTAPPPPYVGLRDHLDVPAWHGILE